MINIFITLLFISVFFFPSIGIFRPEEIIVSLMFGYIIINEFPKFKIPKVKYLYLLFTYLIIIFISVFINYHFSDLSNLLEIFKIIKLIIIFIFIYKYISFQSVFIDKLILYCFIGLVIINLISYLNLFSFNQIIAKYYLCPEDISYIIDSDSTKRLLGLMITPNDNGIIFFFFGSYFLAQAFYGNKKANILMFISILMVLLTQSRMNFITLICVFLFFNVFISKLKFKTVLMQVLIVILVLLVFNLLDDRYYRYLVSLFYNSPSQQGSIVARLDAWNFLFEVIQNHFLIGIGNKNFFYENRIYTDSKYLWLLVQFGILGVINYILLLIWPIYLCITKMNKYTLFAGIFLLTILLTGITNPQIDERISVLIIFSISLCFVGLKNNSQFLLSKNNLMINLRKGI